MVIRDQLLVAHSRANADLIVDYVAADRARLPELVRAVRDGEVRVAQRAAMVLGDLGRRRPDWLDDYQVELLAIARQPAHPALRRNVLRYFSELRPEGIVAGVEGPLVDLAFRLTEDPTVPVGIRVFAMQIVANYCGLYPELGVELREAILADLDTASPGFRSRGRKILRQLARRADPDAKTGR